MIAFVFWMLAYVGAFVALLVAYPTLRRGVRQAPVRVILWALGRDLGVKPSPSADRAAWRAWDDEMWRRRRLMWTIPAGALVWSLLVSLVLAWIGHKRLDVPFAWLYWALAPAPLGVLEAWLTYAGWDGDIGNDLKGKRDDDHQVTISVPSIFKGCAEITKTKPEAWANREKGPGIGWTDGTPRWWSVEVAPPGAITPAQMVGITARLAAFLGLDEDRLLIEPTKDACVRISGADADPWTGLDLTPKWALTGQPTNVFGGMPFARTARGTLVTVPLMWICWLVTAVMRVGKTSAGRLMAAFVALDPIADLAVFDFKGTGWRMFDPVTIRSGHGPGDANALALLDWLTWIERDIDRRTQAIEQLGTGTDGRISRKISARRELGLRPVVTFIDEAHVPLEGIHGAKIAAKLSTVERLGPAVGFVFVILSQLPHTESVPSLVRNPIVGRLALKLMYPKDSELALGNSAHKAGFDASALPYVEGETEGRAILAAGDVPQRVRVLAMPSDLAERVVARAVELRREAGVLPGMDTPPPDDAVRAAAEYLEAHDGAAPAQDLAAHLIERELIVPPAGQTDEFAGTRALAKHLRRWQIRSQRHDRTRTAEYRISDFSKVINGHERDDSPVSG